MDKVQGTVTIDYGVRHGFQRKRVLFTPIGESMTKQSFAAECDINNIMKRYEKDGVITHYNKYMGKYGDFTGAPEYQDALNKVIAADSMFMTLPAHIRTRFENNAGKFLAFVGDPKNKDEMRTLGLLKPEAPPAKVSEPAKA